jgi:hypothetical protein
MIISIQNSSLDCFIFSDLAVTGL